MTIRVGTRSSALAQWQARDVIRRLLAVNAALDCRLVEVVSTGDRHQDLALAESEGTGLFTTALEEALLADVVDLAVHSCKDLPVTDTPGIVLAALPPRGPVEDVLVTGQGRTLATLPLGARIGTCSLRRSAQLKRLRPDVTTVPLRGNVPRRIACVERGELHAAVLAKAGLERLGLLDRAAQVFTVDEVMPAPAQGAIAVQCRSDDRRVFELLSAIDHAPTRVAVTAERTMLQALGAGCAVPVGAATAISGARVDLWATAFDPEGRQRLQARGAGTDPILVGLSVAEVLLDAGAEALLAAAGRPSRVVVSSSGALG